MHYAFRFVLAGLAVWRITHMLAREDGPADVLRRLRRHLGARMETQWVTCFNCLSIWLSLPFALFLKGNAAETFVGWLALSGGAILLDQMTRAPVEMQFEEDGQWDVAAKR